MLSSAENEGPILERVGGGYARSERRRSHRLEVSILNETHIAAAFGEAIAEAVRQAAVDRIERLLRGISESAGIRHAEGDSSADGSVEIADHGLMRVKVASAASSLPEDLLRALALEAIAVGEHRIHIAPSVRVLDEQGSSSAPDNELPLSAVASDAPFAGDPVVYDKGWAERYRIDMSVAARLLGELKDGRLSFAFQPIRMAGRPDSLLYEECLLRGPEEAGQPRRLGLDIMALERLGLVRVLDHHLMWCAIERLRCEPTRRLGINISAQSACVDGWWSGLAATLEAEHELAEHMTLEITETSGIPSISAAIDFAHRMQRLGCRIALDDFGAGRDAIRNLYALQPDIVKIDAFFLRQARQSSKGQAALKSLVGFSRAIGGAVVVEGVETQSDSDAAVQAGAIWQQGFFIDAPHYAGGEPDSDMAAHDVRPGFGRRSPPATLCVDELPSIASLEEANPIPQRPLFQLYWPQLAISLAAFLWALIAGAWWLGWSGSS